MVAAPLYPKWRKPNQQGNGEKGVEGRGKKGERKERREGRLNLIYQYWPGARLTCYKTELEGWG